jgi:hypothetical protein
MKKNGLMEEAEEKPSKKEGKSGAELDASLVYELAMRLLSKPEARQKMVSTVSQATDVGTAIGKLAGMLVSKISDELEARDMPIDDESLFGSSGGLARVLTAIYQTVNEEGLELAMEDSLIQAYEVAEADMDKMLSGEMGAGQAPPQGAVPPGAAPMGPPQGAPPQPGEAPLMEMG